MPGSNTGVAEGDLPGFPSQSPTVANLEAIHFGKANAMVQKRGVLTTDAAEMLAVDALTWLAGEPEALGRFLALAGIGPEMLRPAASDPAFLRGVLDYFVGDEASLVSFARHAGIAPAEVAAAHRVLTRAD
jgi:hypothetical protein